MRGGLAVAHAIGRRNFDDDSDDEDAPELVRESTRFHRARVPPAPKGPPPSRPSPLKPNEPRSLGLELRTDLPPTIEPTSQEAPLSPTKVEPTGSAPASPTQSQVREQAGSTQSAAKEQAGSTQSAPKERASPSRSPPSEQASPARSTANELASPAHSAPREQPSPSKNEDATKRDLAAAQKRSLYLKARVLEEEARIWTQRAKMHDLEKEAATRESLVAAAEAKLAQLEEREALEKDRVEAMKAARAAQAALELAAVEASARARLEAVAKLENDAEASRREAEQRLEKLEARNAALERQFQSLERERAEKEAQVRAAQQREAARRLDASQSLADVLQMDGESPPPRRAAGHMPAPHNAAADGAEKALEAMSDADMVSLDAAKRTPLFYACAHDREDCVALLLRRAPNSAGIEDANGDTPLHAAAAAGAAGCVRRVLEGRAELASRTNHVGMAASHLAANVACLEALLAAGASFVTRDQHNRTPLFVACATNRYDCAHFLLEVLDIEGQTSVVEEPDTRGDTPLHAAACNGAEACVRLLLESGVRCDLANNAGLKPVDLAANHQDCKSLLLEYQLHHAAKLDSVLFLATIEGHKQCKRQLNQTGPDSALERTVSRYSLRRGEAMKLAQWGSWIAYEDPDNMGSVYWYNHHSRVGQWTKPDSVRRAQTAAANEDKSHWEAMRTNSMRLAQIGDWLQYREKGSSAPFYYHPATGDFSWDRPPDLSPTSVGSPGGRLPRTPIDATSSGPRSPTPWASYTDAATGATFWYNHLTHVSQWDPPPDVLLATIEEPDDTAAVVDDLQDLGI